MFNPIGVRRRGFSGRPLVALLFAVGLGIAEYYIGAWFHVSEAAAGAIMVATVLIVAFVWWWAERPELPSSRDDADRGL